MGDVRFGIPARLALALKQDFKIPTFIETGTYHGGTAGQMADHFDRVITIEAHKPYYEIAQKALGKRKNVELLFGNSKDVLPDVLNNVAGPVLFWLDAHVEQKNVIDGVECPLIDELDAIVWNDITPITPYILIDDAHLFLRYGIPHGIDISKWPPLWQVIMPFVGSHIAINEDVIVIVPHWARKTVERWFKS